MLEKFFDYLQFERRFSNHTLSAYRKDLEQFFEFSDIQLISDLGALKPSFIRSWIVQLMEGNYNTKSVNRKLATLRTLYKWLRKENIVKDNPMSRISGPKVEKRLPSFAREQELTTERTQSLFSNDFNGLRDELMFELLYQCGIRLSELIGLTLQDVTGSSIKVLGKRNKERLIPISKELVDLITSYCQLRGNIAKTNRLLILENGKPLYPTFVYRKIHTILGTLTTLDKRSPHVLRHTFATHMLNNGAGLETLKAILGHASLAATQVYTHNSFAQLNQIYRHAHPRMGKS